MVCLGPRKKEKKNNLLSPEDAAKKKGTKLKSSKTATAPSIASTKKRTSTETLNAKSNIARPPSRNSLLSNGRTAASPAQRSTSPAQKLRPTSMASVKSNLTVASAKTTTASRTPSNVSTTKRFPISEMKEEVKDLKAKNEENLKLIADQKAELERLKQQLSSPAPPVQIVVVDEEQEALAKEEEEARKEQLLQREKEIEQLRIQLEEQQLRDEEFQAELSQKKAQLEEQKRLIDEKKPEIEQVAMQLETLKTQNLDAMNQLAAKEKELEELRSMIHEKPINEEQKEEDKQAALSKIEELNKQLEAQKRSHEESLRLHEEALAEKDNLLKEQKVALETLNDSHQEQVRQLKYAQTSSILELKKKHKQDKLQLEQELEQARKEAEQNPTADFDIDEHMERILQEFEQAEHTHAVQIQTLEDEHQSELNHLQDDQKQQINKLKRTQNLTRDSWTVRYLPTEAVSWPKPQGSNGVAKLRPTPSIVESKSKTLLRVLGNMPGYQKPEPVLIPLDPSKVQIYYSSVSGNAVIKKNQEQIQQLLNNNKIKFSLVDVAQSESARQYAKKCNNNGKSEGRIKEFPQIYVGGEYRGQFEDLVRAIDDQQLDVLLHPAEERQFTAEERAAIQKAELAEEQARLHKMPEVPALPQLRPTKSTTPVKTLKDYDEDEELLKALEKELGGGEINVDDL